MLLSLVSRVAKNDVVKSNKDSIDIQRQDHQILKNEVVRHNDLYGRLFLLVNRVDSNVNLNKMLQIVLLIFLQLEFEWVLKKYRVDNNDNLEWLMK